MLGHDHRLVRKWWYENMAESEPFEDDFHLNLDLITIEDAEHHYLHHVMLEPNNPTRWNTLALVYMLTGCIAKAEDAIRKSLDLNTGIASTWRLWGDILMIAGKPADAERAFHLSLELEPNDSHGLYCLSILYRNRGAYSEAMDMLCQLIAIEPNNQFVWDCFAEYLSDYVSSEKS